MSIKDIFSEAQKEVSQIEREKKQQYLPEEFLKKKKEAQKVKSTDDLPNDPKELFRKANPNAPKGRSTVVFDPVIKACDNPEVVLLVSFRPSEKMIFVLEAELKKVYNRYVDYMILYAFDYSISRTDLDKNIENF